MEAEITDALAAQASAVPRRHRSQRRSLRLRTFIPYIFLAPPLLAYFFLTLLPIGYAAWESLFRIQRDGLGLGAPTQVFVGLSNYQRAFTDPELYQGIERVVVYGLIAGPVLLGIALLLALVLDSAMMRLRTSVFFRFLFFLPHVIPGVIAVYIWYYLYNPQISPITQVLNAFHLGTPNYLGAGGVMWAIGNIVVWGGIGYEVLVICATLQAIPPSLYEAARLDGCAEWQMAWYIKVPIILPAIALVSIGLVLGSLQLFNEPYLLSSLSTSISSDFTPNMYLAKTALDGGNYYYAAALSFVWALFTTVLSLGILRYSRKLAGV